MGLPRQLVEGFPANVAMLRVWSREPAWDPEAFLRDHFPNEIAPWWRGGDVHSGRTQCHTGFNLRIAEARSCDHLGDDIVAWVHQHRLALKALQSAAARVEAHIAMAVDAEGQVDANVVFTSAHLQVLAESGIDVKIAAYSTANARELARK